MIRCLIPLFFFSSVICHPSSGVAVEVKEVVSEKGIKAWLVEEHTLPLVVFRVAFVGAGSAYDGDGKEGRAHMVSSLLSEGAGNMDAKAFHAALESRAITFSASVDEDILEVTVETLSEHKNAAFSYLGLAIAKPKFGHDDISRVRRQTLSAITKSKQDASDILGDEWRQRLYGNHPYAHPVIGLEQAVRRLTRNDLREFASHYLTRGNLLIAATGDITPEELRSMLDQYLSGLPEGYTPDVVVPEVAITGGGEPIIKTFDISQTLVAFGTQGLKRSDPDYFAAHVMNQILGGDGVLGSLLVQEIREKRGLAYSAYSGLRPLMHAASWSGGFSTRNEQAGEALNVLRYTLKRFSEEGPTDAELLSAKRYLIGAFMVKLNGTDSLARFLINMQLNNLGIDYLDRRNSLIADVTKNDVKAMAKRLIDADKLAMVMVGKPILSSDTR